MSMMSSTLTGYTSECSPRSPSIAVSSVPISRANSHGGSCRAGPQRKSTSLDLLETVILPMMLSPSSCKVTRLSHRRAFLNAQCQEGCTRFKLCVLVLLGGVMEKRVVCITDGPSACASAGDGIKQGYCSPCRDANGSVSGHRERTAARVSFVAHVQSSAGGRNSCFAGPSDTHHVCPSGALYSRQGCGMAMRSGHGG
jgi:hypothetical protein